MSKEIKTIICGYEIIKKLGEGPQSIVYKARFLKKPEQITLLKILKTDNLFKQQRVHFQQKVEQLKVLNHPLLVRPLTFESKEGVRFITSEYFDGITLNEWTASQKTVSLNDFFKISKSLAEALHAVHEAGVIHGGIKPHNILINPQSLDIRLIDFITSLDVREISHFFYDRSFIEGTLAYTSPEQTGRINYRVDLSSDIYSLGIVFYELLTGKLPFFSLDPLELIHSHLAEEAMKVCRINDATPDILCDLVNKLIMKQTEKRYQSAAGLLSDLTRCQAEYIHQGTITPFPLGKYDLTQRITFISRMVGRDHEADQILEEYNQAANGAFSSMLISGLPGIGKTRLIQELQKPIVERRGYFTFGKFDQYQKNIPYSALIQSLRNLIHSFLTESDERAGNWKRKILNIVGKNGRIITEVIPELEILIGPQPEVEALPPMESRTRFNYVFDKFLSGLANEENPLTIFIDDLQWCDTATFDFLENLFADFESHKYLFFIGAYRENEVDSSHLLTKLIHAVREKKMPLKEIHLEPLEPQYCHEMVSYILESPLAQTQELAAFINRLSEGNPLFVSEMLSYMHNECLLFLDQDRNWQWDIFKIRESNMPPTVVGLFSSKVTKLPPQTVTLLEYCACMGNRFSPTEISMVKEINLLELFNILKSALAQGLLMESKDDLRFVHDRVQEAVLIAIDPEKRRHIHWDIGNHLLLAANNAANPEKLDNIFSIATHLNLGKPEILDAKTAYLLSTINYHAGNKALDALATEAANDYFRLARQLLPEDCWNFQYERTFKIYQKSKKTELMSGHYEISEKLLNQLIDKAKTDLDKAECLAEQTASLSSIGNFIKAIETANRGLAYFDKSIPDDAVSAEKKREKLMSEIESQKINVWQTILNMPFTQERKSKIELAFYSELIPDLYMSGLVPQFFLSAVQSTLHCLAGGMDESVIYSFSIMGLYLGEKGDFEKAFQYEDLARNLCEKYPNTFGATRGMNGIVWVNMHSRSHPEDITAYCLRSIQCGKNSGDLYNAGLSYGPLMWNLQVHGYDFRKIEDCANECLVFSNKYHLNFSVRLAEAMQAGWIEPMKINYAPIVMDEKIKLWEQDNHIASVGIYYVHMGLVHYYFGEHEKAEVYLQEVKRYLKGLTDNVLNRQWHVFLILNAIRLHENRRGYQSRDELFKYIEPLIGKVETWASLGPLLKPYLGLVYAELERVTGDAREARNLYLDAIALAHQYNYIFLEGYISECLGFFLGSLSKFNQVCPDFQECQTEKRHYDRWWMCDVDKNQFGNQKYFKGPACLFIKEARRLYRKCHAERKAAALSENYPEYFEDEEPARIMENAGPALTLPNIDINYLMKSSLIIPVETEENVLLHKIMNVVLESSGAQHGYLIMEENGELIVRTESHVKEKSNVLTVKQKIEEIKDICQAIIRYVYRTKETVLLENASEKGAFKDTPEVQAMKLKSVLCLPVIKQNKLTGILYLENRLADSVFTTERTELTKLFTYEAAISLENARLMERMKQTEAALQQHRDHLEEIVTERTLQLHKTQENLLIAEHLAILGQLAGSISHEIRNPLNVISSSAYYLKMKLNDNDVKFKEHIGRIEAEVKRSTAIIDSLLSLSGMKEPYKAELNLIAVLNNVISALDISDSLEVIKEIPREIIHIHADKEQLSMIFHNLIKNAVEAMNNHGLLKIKVVKEKEQYVKIIFVDNGPGIEAENMEKIFQPLFTTKARGIGFGLSICKMIVEKHKGDISIRSELGKETVVTVRLPLGNK